jgi:hypothetical protein
MKTTCGAVYEYVGNVRERLTERPVSGCAVRIKFERDGGDRYRIWGTGYGGNPFEDVRVVLSDRAFCLPGNISTPNNQSNSKNHEDKKTKRKNRKHVGEHIEGNARGRCSKYLANFPRPIIVICTPRQLGPINPIIDRHVALASSFSIKNSIFRSNRPLLKSAGSNRSTRSIPKLTFISPLLPTNLTLRSH